MNRDYHKWWSPRLGRDMELLVFGHSGTPMLVFPTRMRRFYEYENMGMVAILHPHIKQGRLQLYCVDSVDQESLYASHLAPKERIVRHLRYEEYIVREVVPLIRERDPTRMVVSHGCSLGAFHAVNIALRHPHLFSGARAFSGRFDLTQATESFADLFDGLLDEDVRWNTPTQYLPLSGCERLRVHWQRQSYLLVIGHEDPFKPSNDLLAAQMADRQISCRLEYWWGRSHSPEHWRRMASQFLV